MFKLRPEAVEKKIPPTYHQRHAADEKTGGVEPPVLTTDEGFKGAVEPARQGISQITDTNTVSDCSHYELAAAITASELRVIDMFGFVKINVIDNN